MSTSQHREVASAIIIDIQGRLLLQQRDDVPGILHPGKVGLFGGHCENDETYLQCVVREIHEEISYFVSPDRFEHLVGYNGIDDDGGSWRGEFFIVRNVPVDALKVTEGSLLIIEPGKLAAIEHKLVPSALFAIKALFDIRKRN
jgi:8-oxo-dGTP diphosphatase